MIGLEPALMKPAALTMNVFVSVLVLMRLSRAGYFNWRPYLPFVFGSTPMAFVGGAFTISAPAYRFAVGVTLLYADRHNGLHDHYLCVYVPW